MKFVTLLAVLSLTTVLNPVYATEMANADDDIVSYCNEQAQLAGIEDAAEKAQYVNECIESYEVPAADYQQQGQ
ncbi:MAG: hypothetical protein OEZ38_04895 [Gammaproteobacteria bacterium]|nr:hypothetical protein [Gammaproteobacteria bacterium]